MVKNVNAIYTTDTSDLVKNADYDTNIDKVEKKIFDHDHGKYINTQELTSESFSARLKQENSASKSDIADFVKKATDFDDKLINTNKKVTSYKIRYSLI